MRQRLPSRCSVVSRRSTGGNVPRVRFALALLATLILLAGCQKGPKPGEELAGTTPSAGTDPQSVREGIDIGNTSFIDATTSGSADRFADCFTTDGALLLPGQQIVGRDSIRSATRRLFTQFNVREGAMQTLDVRLVGDLAYETGRWTFAAGPAGQATLPDSGNYVNIWKREAGSWRLWRLVAVPRVGLTGS